MASIADWLVGPHYFGKALCTPGSSDMRGEGPLHQPCCALSSLACSQLSGYSDHVVSIVESTKPILSALSVILCGLR